MKKILIMLALATSLFAQGRTATHPVWHGFQQVADGQIFNTGGSGTDVFKANEVWGVGTIWIESSTAYTDTVTCYIYIQNDAADSQVMIDSVVFYGIDSGGNAQKFDTHWIVDDWAFFALKSSTGQFVADVYVGIE